MVGHKNINVSSFCKLLTFFFSKNIRIYAIFNDRSFNNMLTNDIISFEQQGPDKHYLNYTGQNLHCSQLQYQTFTSHMLPCFCRQYLKVSRSQNWNREDLDQEMWMYGLV